MRSKFRLLPMVIFAAALTLSLKVGVLWQDAAITWSTPAHAQSGTPDAAAPKNSAAQQTASGAGDQGSDDAPPPADAASQFDAATATDAEIELLHKLAERREKLSQRERELDLRASMLSATERRIDSKIAELAKIKTVIEGLLSKHDARQEAKLKSLVKIYENMKPKDAARIFDRLELTILLDVVERMREAKSAPIMAKMTPARAKMVTAALAKRGALPRPPP